MNLFLFYFRTLGVSIKGSGSDCIVEENKCIGEEEVIAADGNYEDVPEQPQPAVDTRIEVYSPTFEITKEDVENYKEKVKKTVIDQIFSKIWPNIIKKIDPVFKKIVERNKLAVQSVPKICIEGSLVQPNVDLRFSNNDKYMRVSPEPLRETSEKKSPICPTSPVPQAKQTIRDCSVPPASPLNIRNSASIFKNATKHLSSVKLGQPPPIVFPSAEKLLSPIPPEPRNILQSARVRKKLSPKNNCSSGKTKRTPPQPLDQDKDEGRFYLKEEGR